MEKIVKGATKIKLAAPKSKYVEPILSATNGGEAGVADVFRTLQLRLRDSTWTIVFKSLIIVHMMIREGQTDAALKYIAESPKRIAISAFTDVQTQGSNIRRYSEYLLERVRGYRETKADVVKVGAGRFRKLTVDKGLLRETEAVQNQISALLKCDLLGAQDPDNEISLTAFRLLTMDLLELFKVMNEGTINVLEHYFEMSRPDAERALNIYKTFGRQTDLVVQYLSTARQYEMSTRLEVPNLKHAPTTLTSSLEDYLNDPDFEVNRRQFLAQQPGKRTGQPISSSKPALPVSNTRSEIDTTFPPPAGKPPSQQPKGPAPDLIDFFESIEQNQQPMAQHATTAPQFSSGVSPAQQHLQNSFIPQQTGLNPFMQQPLLPQTQYSQQLQPDFTGAGFGGYTPQPQPQQSQSPQTQTYAFHPQLSTVPQNGVSEFQQQQQQQQSQQTSPPLQPQQTSTNPFRQSMVQTGMFQSSESSQSIGLNRQSTNPFAKHAPMQQNTQTMNNYPVQSNGSPYTSPPLQQLQQPDYGSTSSFFSPQPTASPPQQPLTSQFSPSGLQPQRTGTNPFAKNRSPPPSTASPVVANPTGSTNPFRQSTFVNQQTGQGWQYSGQGTFSGYNVNELETVPVFPRPGQTQ